MTLSNPRKPDNPLELVNSAFCDLTGYAETEIVGRNCRFLVGPGTDPQATMLLSRAIAARTPVLTEVLNYRRDGTTFRNGVMVTPLFGDDGELVWFLGSQIDLGETPEMGLMPRRQIAVDLVSRLTPRQCQVLEAMACGLLNKQIAWKLKISEKTVKMHRAYLLERLGVQTTAEAIRLGVEAGL